MTTYGERFDDPEELRRHQDYALQARIHTMMPGQVVSVSGRTVSVRPTVLARKEDIQGNITYVPYPVIPDVPLVMLGAGGVHMSFGVSVGDEVELRFASRNIDGFYQTGAASPPIDGSMHNLSDCVAYPCAISAPAAVAAGPVVPHTFSIGTGDGTTQMSINTATGVLSLTAGANFVTVNKSTNIVTVSAEDTVNVLATNVINLNAPVVNVLGILKVNGVVVTVP